MRIDDGTITFSSTTENYWKELNGFKNNTMRCIPTHEVEKYDLIVHPGGYATYQKPGCDHRTLITAISIVHPGSTQWDSYGHITRRLTDVTYYGDRYLFTWRQENDR